MAVPWHSDRSAAGRGLASPWRPDISVLYVGAALGLSNWGQLRSGSWRVSGAPVEPCDLVRVGLGGPRHAWCGLQLAGLL